MASRPTNEHSRSTIASIPFWALFVLLIAAATLIRVVQLEEVPAQLHNDEASSMTDGVAHFLKPPGGWALWGSGFGGHPNLSYWLSAIPSRLVGEASLWSLRMGAAISGILSLVFFALFVAKAFGRRSCIFFLIFAVPFHLHVHYSRTGFPYVHALLLCGAISLAFINFLQAPRAGTSLILGITLGLGALVYPATHVLPFCIIAAIILGKPKHVKNISTRLKSGAKLLSAVLAGLLLTLTPQVVYSFMHGYSSRLSSTLIFHPHNIKHLAPLTEIPAATVVDIAWFNFVRTLKLFYSCDEAEQYRFTESPLGIVIGVLATLGALVLAQRMLKRDTIATYLVAIAISTVVASGLMVEGPFSPHLILFALLIPLSCALGWESFLSYARCKQVGLATIATIAMTAYWTNWNWAFYNRVVDPYRSRIFNVETWLVHLPVERREVLQLINLTKKALSFGETYYDLPYPNATRKRLDAGNVSQLMQYISSTQCPCVVVLEKDTMKSAEAVLRENKKTVEVFDDPRKPIGFLYIRD